MDLPVDGSHLTAGFLKLFLTFTLFLILTFKHHAFSSHSFNQTNATTKSAYAIIASNPAMIASGNWEVT